MIQPFNAGNQGQAISCGSVCGKLIIWAFSPIWVGPDKSGLETVGPNPGGGFNFEQRDGVYIDRNNGSDLPVVLPWNGQVWLLNGKAAGDQVNNIAFIQLISD